MKKPTPEQRKLFETYTQTNGRCGLCGHEIDKKTCVITETDGSDIAICSECDQDKGSKTIQEYAELIDKTAHILDSNKHFKRAIRFGLYRKNAGIRRFFYKKLNL